VELASPLLDAAASLGLLRVTAPLFAALWEHYVLASSGHDRDPTLV
jgi:hypothetical protein